MGIESRLENRYRSDAVDLMRKLIANTPYSNKEVLDTILRDHADMVRGHNASSIYTKISALRCRMGMKLRTMRKSKGNNGVQPFVIRQIVRNEPMIENNVLGTLGKKLLGKNAPFRFRDSLVDAVICAVDAGNNVLAKSLVKVIRELDVGGVE
jgi:hypothetical protein